jgi:hypothetical protein
MKKYLDISAKPPASGSTSLTRSLTQLVRSKSQSKRANAPPTSASSSASLGPSVTRSTEDVTTSAVVPEAARSKDESHKRIRTHKGDTEHVVPSSEMDLLRRSQPSPASMASSAIRQRTKSAPSNPSAALRTVAAAQPLQDSQSTLIRPLVQQTDLARRQQASVAASTTLGAPGQAQQPQRPRSVHVQRLVDGDDATLNGPRRVPITEVLAVKNDRDVLKQPVWPASRVDNVLATSTSKVQAKSFKNGVSNPTVGTKEDKELAKPSTKPVSRPEMAGSTSKAMSQANNILLDSTGASKEESDAQHPSTDTVATTSITKLQVGSISTNPHAAKKEESGKHFSRSGPNANIVNIAPVFKPKSASSQDNRDINATNKDAAESAELQKSTSHAEVASATSVSRSHSSSVNLATKGTKEPVKEQVRPMSRAEVANATSTSISQVNSSSGTSGAAKEIKEPVKEQPRPMSNAEVTNTTSTSGSQASSLSSSTNLTAKETREPAKERPRPMSRAEVTNTTSKQQIGSSRVAAAKGSSRQAQRPMSRAEFRSTTSTSKPQVNVLASKKGKEVSQQERGLKRMRSTPALSSSTTSQANPTEPTATKSNSGPRGDGARGTDVTKPTLAQLARIKPRVAEKKAESSKPIWGRLIPRKVPNTKGKPGNESPQAEQVPSLNPKSVEPNVSPSTSEIAQSIPLPASPTPEVTKVEEQEEADGAGAGPVALANENEETKDDGEEILPGESSDDDMYDSNMTPQPQRIMGRDGANKETMQTPISSLLTSIENGFLVTPLGPLSPPQAYINYPVEALTAFGLGSLRREIPPEKQEALEAVAKGPLGFGLPKWAMSQNRQVLSDVENL